VSTALVSIVMRDVPGASPANRARVLEAAERLGYRPDSRARLLRSGHSRLLGVVFGVQDAFHGDLVTGLYDAADHVGYELALSAFTPNRDEHMAIGGLLQDRCEALILLSLTSPVRELAELATRMPTVILMRAACTRPSTTSLASATGGSRISTAAACPTQPTGAVATRRRCDATA
jgi:DNA-binding LacI/PurR family transcriptional regulator